MGRHDVYVCTNISCSLRGADELLRAHARATAGDDPELQRARLRVPRRVRHRADGLGRRRLRRPARRRRRAGTIVDDVTAGRRGRCPDKQLAERKRRRPPHRRRAERSHELDTLLFEDIDEPGLHTLEVYERRGGYEALRKALTMTPRRGARRARGLRPARPRRRRLRDGQEGRPSCPRATMDKYLVCNADESEPGHLQGPRADAEEPAPADRGHHHRAPTRRAPTARSSTSAASTSYAGRHPRRRASPRPRAAGYLGENILGSDHSLDAGRAPRRRRLHLRRGDRAARLARGQARQPAPEAAVPGHPGPLPGPDADQQRRDAVQPSRSIIADGRRRSTRSSARESSTGTKLVSVSGNVQRPGNYEIELGHPVARDHLRPRRRPARGPRGQALVPRRLVSSPVPDRGRPRPRPTTSTRWPRPARCSARARSSSSTTRPRSSTSRCKTAKFYRHESCGKCTPCREGTNWTVKMLERIDARRGHPDGPRHHGLGPGADHRQLPVRAGRRDGDADRLDDRASSATSSRRTSRRARARELGAPIPSRRSRAGPSRRRRARRGRLDAAPRVSDGHVHDRRPRGQRAREHDAGRRRQARRRRDPGLLLRAQARPAGRRLPHVPGRDRGHPEAADRLLDAGQGRHGRPHPDRPRAARRSRRSSSSCSINHPLDCPVCDKGGECPLQDITFGWGAGTLALHRAQAPLREAARALAADRDRPRALHPLLPLRALLAGDRRGLPAGPRSSAARTPTSAPSTATPTSRRSAATSSSCARWAR